RDSTDEEPVPYQRYPASGGKFQMRQPQGSGGVVQVKANREQRGQTVRLEVCSHRFRQVTDGQSAIELPVQIEEERLEGCRRNKVPVLEVQNHRQRVLVDTRRKLMAKAVNGGSIATDESSVE